MTALHLTDEDRDDLSLAICDAVRALREAGNAASRLGADVRAIEERVARLLALHRRVLGVES